MVPNEEGSEMANGETWWQVSAQRRKLSAERGWVVGQCCHFLGWADPEHSSWPTKISHIPFACKLFAMLSPLAQHSACCPERKVWVKNHFWEPEELVENSAHFHASRRLQGMRKKGKKEWGGVTGLGHNITPLTALSKHPLPKSNVQEKQHPELFDIKFCLCRAKVDGLD